MRILFSVIISFALTQFPSAETTIRFASWNIANFSHLEGVEHRPDIGTKRSGTDFEVLKRYAESLEADVIALQEIGTVEAISLLFPADEFTIRPSEQLAAVNDATGSQDIYTAIVIRKRPDLKFVRQEDLNDLAVIHDADNRPVRSGTAVLLEVDGHPLWVMSVHLKSSCSQTGNLAGSTSADCITFWKQRVPLHDWIAERKAAGEMFAIMGDFNRQFRRFGAGDQFWKALSADGAGQPDLVAHPMTVTRRCPTRLGTSTEPIDWIMLQSDLAAYFIANSYWETRYRMDDITATGGFGHNSRLSDHCPIHIDVAFPG